MNLTTGGTPATLTLERLFDSPGLSGAVPGMARYAPDGRRIAWLRAADDDAERLDLWIQDLEQDRRYCLFDARALTDTEVRSQAEQDRRERLRIFSHGVTEFHWSHDASAVLTTLGGRLYRLALPQVDNDTGQPDPASPEPMTPPEMAVSHVQISTDGRIGFIHARNLWCLHPDGSLEQITSSGGDTISCGLPDFIAQEEMHRHEGFWFAPEGRQIAYIEVDEAPVPVTHRYEMGPQGLTVHPQHYPFTGGPNPTVRLLVVGADGDHRELTWSERPDDYLARVTWTPDGSALIVQRQSRDQRRLQLVRLGRDRDVRVLHEELSETWINLHDDLYLFRDGRHALWSNESEGLRRLWLLDLQQGDLRALTPPDLMVLRLVRVDEASAVAYAEGWQDAPTQQHLWQFSLDPDHPTLERLTPGHGCHQVQLAPDCSTFLDRREHLSHPPCLEVRELGGSLVVELAANRTDTPAHPYHPFLSGHREPVLGELEAEDGQRLCYRLTAPERVEGERYPVIVSVYGGPGVQRVRDAWPPLLHQYLARRGWGVLELDNRGMGGRGRNFERPIHRQLGQVEVADQLRGVDMLTELDWVDPDRIAVFGHSYGGYMALMCLAQHPDRFCAAVSVAPVTDWSLYDTHYTERYLGTPADNPDGYADASVLNHLQGLSEADPGALLLVHGMADDNVLFDHSVQLMDAMQQAGIQFEMMAYPGARHGIAGRATHVHRFRHMERFLEQRFSEAGPPDG